MNNILEEIYEAGLKFLEPLTPQKTYATIVEEAIKLVNGDDGLIILKDGDGLKTVYGSSPLASQVKPRKKGYTYEAFKKRKINILHTENFKRDHPEIAKIGVKSAIFIPLSYKKKSIGVLVIRSFKYENYFTSNEPDVLKLFGSMASLAIRKTQLYDEAKKTLSSRDLFISMAAHEFRTPLTSINGYVHLLYNKLSKENNVEARWVKELMFETTRFTNLVNELLEISRIQAGKLQFVFKEYSLNAAIKQAVNNFHFNYPQRKVIYQDNIPKEKDKAIYDFEKILQVITNLLDNAAKYSSPNTNIAVTLNFKSPYLILHVIDRGKGIEKKDLPLIFKDFYKGGKNEEEGMGIGLYLAKNIITKHKGKINIYSKIGKGTIVEVKLPRAKI